MNIYLQPYSGISGDMFVGAMVDLGANFDGLCNFINSLNLPDIGIKIDRVRKKGILGVKFSVFNIKSGLLADEEHSFDSTHRSLSNIEELLANVSDEQIRKDAIDIFKILGESEASVHGVDIEEVHFHEVGALDSIVDIVASAFCIKELGVYKVLSSPVNVGFGKVLCAHGELPVPAPATMKILEGCEVYSDGTYGELTTPTGASILKYYCSGFTYMPKCIPLKVGYGAGTKELSIPNLLRAISF